MAVAATLAVGGCGDREASFPPAAEPAVSPPLTEPAAGELIARLGPLAEGLAVDSRSGLAAAITREPQALSLIDVESGRIVRRVPLRAVGRHLELRRPGGPVLVPVEGSDELVSVPLVGGRARSVAVGDFPHDAAVAAGRIFVGNEMGDTVTVLEPGRRIATVPAPVQPGGLAATSGQVAVVAVAERVLRVYDARTLEVVGEAGAGAGPTHVVADAGRAFVADTDGGAILEFKLGPEPMLTAVTAAPGAPYGIALDRRRDRLWVTLTARNEAVEYALGDDPLEELARYPTVRQPNTIAIDPGTGDALILGKAGSGPLERIPGS